MPNFTKMKPISALKFFLYELFRETGKTVLAANKIFRAKNLVSILN